MNKLFFLKLFLVSYLATFLRFYLNNNLVVSTIGSFLYGFVIARTKNKSKREILITGFCSCFTSFSGFLHILYQLLINGYYLNLFLYLNLIVILNLIIMNLGFSLSRKMT